MWPLFVAIGVGFLLLLSYGWGLGTGVKLGKKSQSREHEAYRAVAERALEAHRVEREAWLETAVAAEEAHGSSTHAGPHDRLDPERESSPRAKDAAEKAHQRTREAFLALRSAWGDSGPDDAEGAAKSALKRADSRPS